MLRLVATHSILFILAIFLPLKAYANYECYDDEKYLRKVMGPAGYIDQQLHDDFWKYINKCSGDDGELGIDAVRQNLLLAQEYQLETFRSAILSRDKKRLVRTQRMIDLERDYPLVVKSSFESITGKASFEGLEAMNSRLAISFENAKRILEAAAAQRAAVTLQGSVLDTDRDTLTFYMDRVSIGFERLENLLNKDWTEIDFQQNN